MTRRPALKLASPDDAPRQFTIVSAAAEGTSRDLLVALRARLAMAVEDASTPPRDLASLSRRLLEVARDIDAIDARERKGDEVGDAAATPDEAWSPTGS